MGSKKNVDAALRPQDCHLQTSSRNDPPFLKGFSSGISFARQTADGAPAACLNRATTQTKRCYGMSDGGAIVNSIVYCPSRPL